MLSLITGMPGTGKTSLMVHLLMTRKDLQNRPIYVDGIPELKIPHEEIPDGEDMTTWHKWAPPHAVLIIDEAQRIFRPRKAGAEVPDYVQALETHRHDAVDMFILTQHPRLIDVNLRSLIGEHRNITKTMLGVSRISYWQRCGNPDSKADIAEARNSVYRLKKSTFDMYKSAEAHTKLKSGVSRWVWIMPIALILIGVMVYRLMDQYDNMKNPKQTVTKTVESSAYTASNPVPEYKSSGMGDSVNPEDFKPSIPGQPWTAPAYAHLRQVTSLPYPAACISMGDDCNCYTDQGTRINGLDSGYCTEFVAGRVYNPYRQIQTATSTAAPPVQQSVPDPVRVG